jgi:hypothetical protein
MPRSKNHNSLGSGREETTTGLWKRDRWYIQPAVPQVRVLWLSPNRNVQKEVIVENTVSTENTQQETTKITIARNKETAQRLRGMRWPTPTCRSQTTSPPKFKANGCFTSAVGLSNWLIFDLTEAYYCMKDCLCTGHSTLCGTEIYQVYYITTA